MQTAIAETVYSVQFKKTVRPAAAPQNSRSAAAPLLPASTGDWAADCRLGRDHASRLIVQVRNSGDYPRLGQTMKAVATADSWSGVHAGFCQQIAELVAA